MTDYICLGSRYTIRESKAFIAIKRSLLSSNMAVGPFQSIGFDQTSNDPNHRYRSTKRYLKYSQINSRRFQYIGLIITFPAGREKYVRRTTCRYLPTTQSAVLAVIVKTVPYVTRIKYEYVSRSLCTQQAHLPMVRLNLLRCNEASGEVLPLART